MSLLDPEPTEKDPAYLGRWFLLGGSCGVCLGLLVMIPAAFALLGDRVLLVFPASLAALAEPHTGGEKALLVLVEYGGQFLLYGMGGLALGFALFLVRRSGK